MLDEIPLGESLDEPGVDLDARFGDQPPERTDRLVPQQAVGVPVDRCEQRLGGRLRTEAREGGRYVNPQGPRTSGIAQCLRQRRDRVGAERSQRSPHRIPSVAMFEARDQGRDQRHGILLNSGTRQLGCGQRRSVGGAREGLQKMAQRRCRWRVGHGRQHADAKLQPLLPGPIDDGRQGGANVRIGRAPLDGDEEGRVSTQPRPFIVRQILRVERSVRGQRARRRHADRVARIG